MSKAVSKKKLFQSIKALIHQAQQHILASVGIAPVQVLGALNLPGVPMNIILENAMLADEEKVGEVIIELLDYYPSMNYQ